MLTQRFLAQSIRSRSDRDRQMLYGPDEPPLRAEWPAHFPPVYIHAGWRQGSPEVTLQGQPQYRAAKKFGNFDAAEKIVEFLLNEEAIYRVSDVLSRRRRGREVYVVAPARTYGDPQNAITPSFAIVLANELGLKVCKTIYQYDGVKRDQTGFWQRFSNCVRFYGRIFENSDYIIADDVMTTGSTMAALRGFIESQGGRVICMTALASPDGYDVPIALDRPTLVGLNSRYGSSLDPYLMSELGYGLKHLTQPEGAALLGMSRTAEQVRGKIHEARYGRDVAQS